MYLQAEIHRDSYFEISELLLPAAYYKKEGDKMCMFSTIYNITI